MQKIYKRMSCNPFFLIPIDQKEDRNQNFELKFKIGFHWLKINSWKFIGWKFDKSKNRFIFSV